MRKPLAAARAFAFDVLTAGTGLSLELGERSRVVFLNAVTLAGGTMIALFAAINFSVGNAPLGATCAAASAVVFANFAFIRLAKRFTIGGAVDCAAIFVFYFSLAYTGGEAGSGVLWSMTYPLITLFLLGPLWGSVVALAYGAAVGVAIFHPALNNAGFPPLYSARVVGTYFFIWLFALIYEQVRKNTLARLIEANAELSRVTGELVAQKRQTDDILANVLEGIFLLDGRLRLGEAHSSRLEELLERPSPAGEDFLGLLEPAMGERDLAAARDYLELFLSGTVNEELLAEINPLADADLDFPRPDGSRKHRRLRFQFIRIASSSAPYPVLGVITDATDEFELKRRLEAEELDHKRRMESLFQIVHVDPAMMSEFIADTEAELETVNELMQAEEEGGRPVLEALYQSAHAIKGNAALLGLEEFSKRVHAYEEEVKAKLEGGHAWRDLLALTLGLADIKRELDAVKELIGKVLRFQEDSKAAGLKESSLLLYSIEKIVKRESARTGLPVSVDFEGFGANKIPECHRKLAKDLLYQLIRNSFAHGFEDAETRAALGKAAAGRIGLRLERGEGGLNLVYSDDGAGLDPEVIRAKALNIPELADKARTMGPGELARLIFHPGFSTAKGTSLAAGRGMGLSMVRRRVAEAGGRIAVRTAKGKFLEFSISLPLPSGAASGRE